MIKKAFYLLTFAIIGIGTYYAAIITYKKMLRHHNVMVHCATSINTQTIEAIKDFCSQHASLINIDEWTTDLKKNFPLLVQ